MGHQINNLRQIIYQKFVASLLWTINISCLVQKSLLDFHHADMDIISTHVFFVCLKNAERTSVIEPFFGILLNILGNIYFFNVVVIVNPVGFEDFLKKFFFETFSLHAIHFCFFR